MRTRCFGNESRSSVCSARQVLQRQHVQRAEQQQLVGAIESRQHRPVEERRCVDHDHVERLASNLEQAAELGLRHELCILRSKRSRQDLEPARVLGRVTGQLLGVELTRGDDQVIDRLLGLDAEHDRGVPELQVEVEKQCLAPLELRAGSG